MLRQNGVKMLMFIYTTLAFVCYNLKNATIRSRAGITCASSAECLAIDRMTKAADLL